MSHTINDAAYPRVAFDDHLQLWVALLDMLITYYQVVLVCFLVTIQGSWLCLGLARRLVKS